MLCEKTHKVPLLVSLCFLLFHFILEWFLLLFLFFPLEKNSTTEVEYISCGKSIDVSLIVPFITYNCSINASCSFQGFLIVWAMKIDETVSLLSLIDLSPFHYSISSQEQVSVVSSQRLLCQCYSTGRWVEVLGICYIYGSFDILSPLLPILRSL